MPHEIFLTAVVPDADAPKARAVLSGVTEMHERHHFTKIRYLHRKDPGAKSLDPLKSLQQEKSPNAVRWKELHQILLKQPFIIQERVDISQEMINMNQGQTQVTPLTANKLPAVKWCDIPDPPSNRIPAFITQRKSLEIIDRRIEKIITDCKFGTRGQSVEESYHWWLNNVEYALTKSFAISAQELQAILDPATLEPLAPFWILYVRIQADSNPERMQQAHAQLSRLRDRFLRVFDFKMLDRRALDTRNIEPPRS